jgi:4-amino-4-deoxy-L-arabinose transferase-like glycosyltransferase
VAAVTTAPSRRIPRIADVRAPGWFERIPFWARATGLLLAAMAISAYLRTRFIGGQFWMDEAITTGIASHSVSQIPGILRHDGNPPLYYLLLHFWMRVFGTSESATHSLSLLFGLLTVPAGMWAGWTLFGRRAGMMAAVLFAFSAWLTYYAQETRMYELMALLGIFLTVAFIKAFVYRSRGYLILFGGCLALMLYTHSWGVFVVLGSIVALIPSYAISEDRRALVRDALLTFVAAGILFLPWVPNLIYQAAHTAAPWSNRPGFGTPILISRQVLGGDRVTIVLLVAAAIGLANLFTRSMRRTREAAVLWSLICFCVATLFVAWLASQANPAYVPRYFAPVVASILLIAAFGCSRAGVVGWAAIVLSVLFLLNPGAVAPSHKSNVRDISGEVMPLLRPGDLVVVGQPEQTSLTWYYLPPGLRFANTIGRVGDPRYMNWVDALSRLKHAHPAATLNPLVASLKAGQQLLYVRPLTEGVKNWEAPWTKLVRRRAAQWGAILWADQRRGILRAVQWAPHTYSGDPDIANSAVLYAKNG